MLEERRRAVLHAIVEGYVATSEPVGSRALATASPSRGFPCHHPQRHGGARGGGAHRPAPHLGRAHPHRQGVPLLRRPPRGDGPPRAPAPRHHDLPQRRRRPQRHRRALGQAPQPADAPGRGHPVPVAARGEGAPRRDRADGPGARARRRGVRRRPGGAEHHRPGRGADGRRLRAGGARGQRGDERPWAGRGRARARRMGRAPRAGAVGGPPRRGDRVRRAGRNRGAGRVRRNLEPRARGRRVRAGRDRLGARGDRGTGRAAQAVARDGTRRRRTSPCASEARRTTRRCRRRRSSRRATGAPAARTRCLAPSAPPAWTTQERWPRCARWRDTSHEWWRCDGLLRGARRSSRRESGPDQEGVPRPRPRASPRHG